MTIEGESLQALVDAQGEKVRIMKEKMKEDPSSFNKADLDAEVFFNFSTKMCVRPWAERGECDLHGLARGSLLRYAVFKTMP